jgi:hypothetical protein
VNAPQKHQPQQPSTTPDHYHNTLHCHKQFLLCTYSFDTQSHSISGGHGQFRAQIRVNTPQNHQPQQPSTTPDHSHNCWNVFPRSVHTSWLISAAQNEQDWRLQKQPNEIEQREESNLGHAPCQSHKSKHAHLHHTVRPQQPSCSPRPALTKPSSNAHTALAQPVGTLKLKPRSELEDELPKVIHQSRSPEIRLPPWGGPL